MPGNETSAYGFAKPRGRPLAWWTGMLLLCAAVSNPLAAQPEELPSPDVIIEILRSTYRAGPIAEHVEVEVIGDSGRRVGNVTIKLDASEPFTPRLRLHLTPLEIWCTGDKLVAVSARNDTLAFEGRLNGPPSLEVIGEALRPLPLPQLELAFSSDARLVRPTPFTPEVRWLQVIEDRSPLGGPKLLMLVGRSGTREVKLLIDKATDRLRGLEAQIGPSDDPGSLTLEISVTPIRAGSPDEWAISTEGRELTDRLTQLTRRRGEVRVGEIAPEITLVRPGGSTWSLLDELARARERADPPHALALVLHRFDADADRMRDNNAWALIAMEALSPDRVSPWRLERHAGRIFELGEYDGGPEALIGWDAESHGPLHVDHSPGESIGLFSRGARAVLVLIGMNRRVVHVARLTGQTSEGVRLDALDSLQAAFPQSSVVDPEPGGG
jgi:hypothetical protein